MNRILAILTSPHGLLALLFLLASGVYFFVAPSRSAISIEVPNDQRGTNSVEISQDIRLVVVDNFGLPRRYVVELEVSPKLGKRIEQVMTKLRIEMLASGGWPEELGVPKVYLQEIDNQLVAILDFSFIDRVSVDVTREINLYQAIAETVLSNGVNRILLLKNGRPAETFLGHLSVPNKP